MLENKGINISNLCGVSTDGAAVMIGNKSGVVKRLKDQTPGVLATHCIAHRLALSCCSGADTIPYLVKVQEILNSVYKYFHYSPKNIARLETIQALSSGPSSRFKQVFHTRWLSFASSVDTMVSNFCNLVSVFLEEKSGKSLSMHKSIKCFKFLFVTHFLCDILKPVSILSKMFQKSDLDFSEVTPLLSSTIKNIENLQDTKNCERLDSFLASVPSVPQLDEDGLCTFQFENHCIRDSDKQRSEAASVCEKFVTSLIKSLNERFSDNADSEVLSALSNMFNPLVEKSSKDREIDILSDYLGSVGMLGCKGELRAFVDFSHTMLEQGCKALTCTRDMANLALKHQDVYPGAAKATRRLLVATVSTVECERGFSRQNIIKTCLRNSLSIEVLDDLMRISIDGPPLEQFDFKLSFKKWASQKTRRILSIN